MFAPVQNKLLGFFLFRLLFCFRLYLFDTLWIILLNFQGCITVYLSRFFLFLSVAVSLSAAATILSISCHFLSVNNFFQLFFKNLFCFCCLKCCDKKLLISHRHPISKRKRRKRDLNPRAAQATYTLSRGASSASWVFLHSLNYSSTNI